MPSCARVVWVVMTLAAPAAAQSTTEDGIRAVLKGDYSAAVRILRPLADDSSRPDPAAQFFLAILHDTGHASDSSRACALFFRAAQQPNPFAGQSEAIAAVIRDQFGPAASMMCSEHEGWQGSPTQSFVLGGLSEVEGAATADSVSAQTTTADGVAALARGDYQRAVEILKPIAEDPWAEDTAAAQFFMAGLYESGDGVPVDPLRACALYERAIAKYDNPFGQEASKLFAPFVSRGQEFNDECLALANVGFDSGFDPATFDLGSGHYVEWTLSAATVTYKGRTRRVPMGGMVQRGARFLPLQYTELATGPTRSLSRHFIEMFAWEPSGRSGPWRLRWFIFEVVRDEIIIVDTFEALTTANGDAPPSRESFNPRDYAVLRADDGGNAEWAVLKGPRHGTHLIETDAERREVREEAHARDAALEAVDWTKRLDMSRQPTMNYADADGCGQAHVYGWSADRAEAVVVDLDGTALGLSTGSATFDLARQSANISVQTYVYERAQRQFQFCSDFRETPGPGAVEPEIWRAIAGAITVELSPPGVRAGAPYLRYATVTLSNVVLRNAAGTTVRITRSVKLAALVGGMAE